MDSNDYVKDVSRIKELTRREYAQPFDAQKLLLHRADVVFISRRFKINPLKWLPWLVARGIRLVTRSDWNHSALVFVIPDPDKGFTHTFVIEAEGQGIDIHPLDKYLHEQAGGKLIGGSDYVIGVKRLRLDWPEKDPDAEYGQVWFERQVRGFALNSIDDSYALRDIAAICWRLLKAWIRRPPVPEEEEGLPGKRPPRVRGVLHDKFICSGFIQFAYYHAAKLWREQLGLVMKNLAFSKRVHDIILQRNETDPELNARLRQVTPEDLASSPNLCWKYLIKDDKLWNFDAPSGSESSPVRPVATAQSA